MIGDSLGLYGLTLWFVYMYTIRIFPVCMYSVIEAGQAPRPHPDVRPYVWDDSILRWGPVVYTTEVRL